MLHRLLPLAVLPGCMLFPCGDYVISNTEATNAEGDDYNGHWHETCTADMGSSGVWEWNPGYSEIWFSLDGRGFQGIDVEIIVGLPTASLAPDMTIGIDEMYGGASLNPCIDCPQDVAGLTEGTIEVKSGDDNGDPCAEDGPDYRLEWDLVYGDGSGPTYELHGNDRILFSNFTTDACSSW